MTSIFPVAVLAFAVPVSAALAQEPSAYALQPVVVTTGQAIVMAQPDRAYVVIAAAGSGGATSIGGVRFDVSNREARDADRRAALATNSE